MELYRAISGMALKRKLILGVIRQPGHSPADGNPSRHHPLVYGDKGNPLPRPNHKSRDPARAPREKQMKQGIGNKYTAPENQCWKEIQESG